MHSKEEIFQILKELLHNQFEIELSSIKLDAKLYEDLDLDSIDAVDLVVKLQDLSGKKISHDEFRLVHTVEDVVNAVYKLMNE
jgi:acyl carrier protein